MGTHSFRGLAADYVPGAFGEGDKVVGHPVGVVGSPFVAKGAGGLCGGAGGPVGGVPQGPAAGRW